MINVKVHHELCALNNSHTLTCANLAGGNLPFQTILVPESAFTTAPVGVLPASVMDVVRLVGEGIASKEEARKLLGLTDTVSI